jgi:photosystem II stability/assembly factor-like uncharacterized protein
MRWRSGVAVLAAAFMVVLAAASPATAQKSDVVAGHLILDSAWSTSADVAWVWAQNSPIATGSQQEILRTADGGKSWTNVTPVGRDITGGTAYVAQVDVLNDAEAWLVRGRLGGHVWTIEFTKNEGRTWSTVGPLPSTCSIQFFSQDDGWCSSYDSAAGSMSILDIHTSDGGRHWTYSSLNNAYSDPKGSLPYACDKLLYFENADAVWADFDCNHGVAPIYESLDDGALWVRRISATPRGAVDAGSRFVGAPVVSGPNVAVGFTLFGPARQFVDVSTDGGRNFAPVPVPRRHHLMLQDLISPTSWKFLWGHTVYSTDNAGATWNSVASNVDITALRNPKTLQAITVHFTSTKVGWLLGSKLWRTVNGGAKWTWRPIPNLETSDS